MLCRNLPTYGLGRSGASVHDREGAPDGVGGAVDLCVAGASGGCRGEGAGVEH